MSINISDYKRNGVFIKEVDNSVFQTPIQSDLITLVVGVSKKGPVNKPILISSPQELYQIFGNIDYLLEKKGCFFHRTILNILNNSPVWAVNLLNVDDELDLLEWQSISLASNVINTTKKESPYSRFFDRSEFWERDNDAFISLADENREDDNHILHITNMSDKKVSVFIYKSNVSGYDDTLDLYYGSIDKVPAYLNPKDQAKDYIVSMLIVAGDWSDYATLSVDSRWGKYFNTNGLRKDQINNFRNDTANTILRYYADLSLIPYFKDLNGRDIFIETIVNRDTNRHGIFIAFDIDRLEDTDYRNGMIDLIGSNIVNSDTSIINYLSYNEIISENISYSNVELDRQGNAFGKNVEYDGKYYGVPIFTEVDGVASTEITVSGITSYNLNNLNLVPSSEYNVVTVNNVNIGKIRKDSIYLDDSGSVGIVHGIEVSNQTQWENVPLSVLPSRTLPIGIVYVGEQASSGSGVGLGIEDIIIIENIEWLLSNNTADISIIYPGSNEIVFEFIGTKNSDLDTNYRKTILNQLFDNLQSNLISGSSIILDSTGNKITINNIIFNTVSSENKSVIINVSPSININNGDDSIIYFTDDEQIFIPSGTSGCLGFKTIQTPGYGIISKNSDIYKSYRDGIINSGDYIYPNLFDVSLIQLYTDTGNSIIKLNYNSGDIDSTKLNTGRKIKLTGTLGNDKIFTILSNSGEQLSTGIYNRYVEVIVNESVLTETIENVTISGANDTDIRYLKMYLESNNMTLEFTQDPNLIGVNSIDLTEFNLDNIRIFSKRTNYKQSLEIESIIESNEILVSAERYGEVKIGEYLRAYVNEDELQLGEVPKKLTRIIGKQLFQADPTLISIKTDSAIDITVFGNDKQTFRYTTMEDYVNTYNALTFKGFQKRVDSMPNGTEQRQNDILNMIAVGTPLFKGLVNRNKIDYRYLVDCFGLGLTSNSKQQLVDLCGERLTVFGIINMPSAKSFKKSISPSFVNDDKSLNLEYIRLGADPNSNPSFRYSFATGKGQSNIGYFFPYVTISDNDRPLDVPPSIFIASTFLRKHNTRIAGVKPWVVAAGITNGVVNGIGNVEMDFSNTDLENLNQMGANPITYQLSRGLFTIENDNTAQQNPKSSLSYIHAREGLIELENELYNMLLLYQWKDNSEDVRDTIKQKADDICDRFVKERGLYAYQNIMNLSNNTPDIIDAQIGVLSTGVEIIKNMGIMVNEVTIYETGGLESSGFGQ